MYINSVLINIGKPWDKNYYYPNFTAKDTEARRSKATQLVSDRARIQIQAVRPGPALC